MITQLKVWINKPWQRYPFSQFPISFQSFVTCEWLFYTNFVLSFKVDAQPCMSCWLYNLYKNIPSAPSMTLFLCLFLSPGGRGSGRFDDLLNLADVLCLVMQGPYKVNAQLGFTEVVE